MSKDAEKKDELYANLLLALQEEEDNPYEVSDEMLVAYSEGKLSSQDAKVVARCLAHNPDALASAVSMSKSYLAHKNKALGNVFFRLHQHFIDKIDYRQRVTLSGMATACVIAIAIIFMLPKNHFKALDIAFNDMANMATKPEMMIAFEAPSEHTDRLIFKGNSDSFLLQGLRLGLKEGLLAFLNVSQAQRLILDEIPMASAHCNNALPIDMCRQTVKHGIYLGKFLAWIHAQCLLRQGQGSVATDVHIDPILREIETKDVFSSEILQMAAARRYECPSIENTIGQLISSR